MLLELAAPEQRRRADAADVPAARRGSCRRSRQVLGDERFLNWLKTSRASSRPPRRSSSSWSSIPAAYFTARFRFPGRMAFLLLVLVTQMFSPTSLVVGLYREFFELNMVNTYGALILTNAAFNLAFAVWILHGFFSSIPKEVEEAADLDGCGRLRTLRRVMLPLTLPGLVTAIDLHVHRGVERVRRRADADDRRRQEAADGRHHVLRHRLRAALGPAVRRLDHRHRAGRDPLRDHREAPRRRPDRRAPSSRSTSAQPLPRAQHRPQPEVVVHDEDVGPRGPPRRAPTSGRPRARGRGPASRR